MKTKLLIPFLFVALLVSLIGNMWQTAQRGVAEHAAEVRATAAERQRTAFEHQKDQAIIETLTAQLAQARAKRPLPGAAAGELHAPIEMPPGSRK